MASLIVVSGPSRGDYYPLGNRTMVIGRAEGVPIQITDELVSRKHCQVRCNEDPAGERKYQLTDMNSANGMIVNGRRVDDVALEDGDVIDIGNSQLHFSKQNFPDRESALNHFQQRGQRDKNTLVN